MTDSRPEITVRAEGAFVVLKFTNPQGCAREWWEIPLSASEALILVGQLHAELMVVDLPKSWRDRAIEEPML